MKYTELPEMDTIEKTAAALRSNNFSVHIAATGAEAKEKVLSLIPKNAEVMTATSETLNTLSLNETINTSGDYESVMTKLSGMSRETDGREMQRIGAAPEYVVGSVHAITQDGSVIIASNSGSQLPAYAYGADHVIWVVGAQKIVQNTEEAIQRIYDHVLPLESERAKKAYGVEGSFVSKLLTFNKEREGRISIILVNEVLGY